MVQQSLVEYIRRLLEQGYDSGTIRTTLLNAGYSPYDVDASLRATGSPGKKIGGKPLIIAFVIILFASAGALLLLKLLQAPPIELQVSVNLFSTEIAPGQEVVVNIDIRNPSGRSVDGLIDFEVSGPGGRVASKTEKFSVVSQASVPASIQLPPTIVPGAYTVFVKVSYKGKSEQASRGFSVVESVAQPPAAPVEALKNEAEEAARELQLTCPGGCDDLNFCTNDACVQGQCQNVPVTPCCGNAQCEQGESKSSCVLDCSERPVDPADIEAKARDRAKSDLAGAVAICETLMQRSYVDGCLSVVAEASENKEPCTKVVNSDVRDGCFITFAYKNDFSVCSEIKNEYMKTSCNTWAQISATKPS